MPSTIGLNSRGVIVVFFNARTGELLITMGDFRSTGGDDGNVDLIGGGIRTSTGFGASRRSIGFVACFLGRLSTRSGDYCFENSARVFVLTRRTRFGGTGSEGAFLAKRLERRPPAMWNSF